MTRTRIAGRAVSHREKLSGQRRYRRGRAARPRLSAHELRHRYQHRHAAQSSTGAISRRSAGRSARRAAEAGLQKGGSMNRTIALRAALSMLDLAEIKSAGRCALCSRSPWSPAAWPWTSCAARRRTSDVVKSFALPIGADARAREPEKAGKELAAQLAAAGIRERRCVVCIPANWALTTSTDVPGDGRGGSARISGTARGARISDRGLPICGSRIAPFRCRMEHAARRSRRCRRNGWKRSSACSPRRAAGRSRSRSGWMPACRTDSARGAAFRGEWHPRRCGRRRRRRHRRGALAAGPAGPEAAPLTPQAFSREVRITLGRLPDALRQQVRQARFGGTPRPRKISASRSASICSGWGSRAGCERDAGRRRGSIPAPRATPPTRISAHQPVAFEFLPPQVNRWQTLSRQFRRSPPALGRARRARAASSCRSSCFSSARTWRAAWTRSGAGCSERSRSSNRCSSGSGNSAHGSSRRRRACRCSKGSPRRFPSRAMSGRKACRSSTATKVTCTGFARNQSALLGVARPAAQPARMSPACRSSKCAARTRFSFPSPTNGSRNDGK